MKGAPLAPPASRLKVRDLALCTYCPKMCRAVCPVGLAERRETTTTWGKMWQGYRSVTQGEPVDADVLSLFEACTGCGACAAFCEHGVDAALALCLLRGRVELPAQSRQARLVACYEQHGRGSPRDLAACYHSEVERAPATTALFAGEAALLERPGLAALGLRVLDEAGLSCGAVPAQAAGLDSGKALLWCGQTDRFIHHASRVARALQGVEVIVCLDPEDAYFLSAMYPRFGVALGASVRTLVEELSRVIDRLPERPGPRLVYHDPCYLGRRLGVYAAPRRVIEHVLTVPPLEFAWSHEHSECVGGAGLYPHSNPQGAREAARRRWRSRPSEAEAIVTACPRAEAQLIEVGATVMDVIELVAGTLLPATRQQGGSHVG